MKNNLDTFDERTALYSRARGHCQTCGKPVAFGAFQLAHCICDSKANRRKYGAHIIDHAMNKRVTCSLYCNSRQNIGQNPEKCRALVWARRIKDESEG